MSKYQRKKVYFQYFFFFYIFLFLVGNLSHFHSYTDLSLTICPQHWQWWCWSPRWGWESGHLTVIVAHSWQTPWSDWLCMMMLESCDCRLSGAVICFFYIELFSQRLHVVTNLNDTKLLENYHQLYDGMDVILMWEG